MKGNGALTWKFFMDELRASKVRDLEVRHQNVPVTRIYQAVQVAIFFFLLQGLPQKTIEAGYVSRCGIQGHTGIGWCFV